MEDEQILNLYFARSEQAIGETAGKYGPYCHAIAYHILENEEDTEECVSDTWLSAWNTIPPKRPSPLSTFLGRVTRNLSIDRWRKARAFKRGGGQMALALEELKECVSGTGSLENDVIRREALAAVNRFLGQLGPVERNVFLCRYWYLESSQEIAEHSGFSQAKVRSMLHRIRGKLDTYLEKEGLK